jgi:hypothetical protein
MYATITIFDCLDQVMISVSVRRIPDPPMTAEPWKEAAVLTIPGSGATDVHEWLRDALVAVLEAT